MKEKGATWPMIPISQADSDCFSRYPFSKLEQKFSLGLSRGKNYQLLDLSKFNTIQHRWISIEWPGIPSESIHLRPWDILFLKSLLGGWMVKKFEDVTLFEIKFHMKEEDVTRSMICLTWLSYQYSLRNDSSKLESKFSFPRGFSKHPKNFFFWSFQIWYHSIGMNVDRVKTNCIWFDHAWFSRYLIFQNWSITVTLDPDPIFDKFSFF